MTAHKMARLWTARRAMSVINFALVFTLLPTSLTFPWEQQQNRNLNFVTG